ncbi:MAG: Fic family protein [bacterium]|nr:Fic family protein [bacterium]
MSIPKNHILPLLPPDEQTYPALSLLTDAYLAIGELKGRLISDVINPSLIVGPLLNKEAVASAKIEGTQTTVEEVLKYEAQNKAKENPDIKEVLNYRRAIFQSIELLHEKPIGENLIKTLHRTLLTSVRGREKDPGNFRKTHVHLGKPGSTIEDAAYVPPVPGEIVPLMQNWVNYIHNSDNDLLIKVAISHYQFEAIHPFLDGNGRVGRLLIPIILFEQGLIPYPYFYISEYFEEHRGEYYEALRLVDRNRDWNSWIQFFLVAIKETAIRMQSKVGDIYELYDSVKSQSIEMNSQYAQVFMDLLFERPVISAKEIIERLEQPSRQTLYTLIDKFEQKQIIKEITGNKRNKVYAFRALIDIIK